MTETITPISSVKITDIEAGRAFTMHVGVNQQMLTALCEVFYKKRVTSVEILDGLLVFRAERHEGQEDGDGD